RSFAARPHDRGGGRTAEGRAGRDRMRGPGARPLSRRTAAAPRADSAGRAANGARTPGGGGRRRNTAGLTGQVPPGASAATRGPPDLRHALELVRQPPRDRRVLVDASTLDDAGVFAHGPGTALVQTVDFFTPIVDDPYDFGRVAAANSLSDVYAMGGRPLTALNIACYPDKLDPEGLGLILRGGQERAAAAGVAVGGGQTGMGKGL